MAPKRMRRKITPTTHRVLLMTQGALRARERVILRPDFSALGRRECAATVARRSLCPRLGVETSADEAPIVGSRTSAAPQAATLQVGSSETAGRVGSPWTRHPEEVDPPQRLRRHPKELECETISRARTTWRDRQAGLRTLISDEHMTPEHQIGGRREPEPVWARDLLADVVMARAVRRRTSRDDAGKPPESPELTVSREWDALQQEAARRRERHQDRLPSRTSDTN
jgi:hypothetical protein